MRPYILKEASWKTLKTYRYDLAVLPWGATEAHNYHLPYGTDVYEADAIAAEGARKAWEKGTKVVVLAYRSLWGKYRAGGHLPGPQPQSQYPATDPSRFNCRFAASGIEKITDSKQPWRE